MPGPYIHLSSMRHVISRLAEAGYVPKSSSLEIDGTFINPEWTGLDLREAARLMKTYPSYASLGAIGPDLAQFLPDFPKLPFLAYVVDFLMKLWDEIDKYIEWWDNFAGPVTEDADEFLSRVTGGLSEDIEEIFSKLTTIIVNDVEGLVVSAYDWIGLFSLEMNVGYDEQAFTWMDMLHYRSTGHFGRALWELADKLFEDADLKDKLRAYALGYMTHLGTDVTGHPFVNAIASGPYREHWNRHHLVEVQSDAFWYLADPLAGAPRNIDGYPQFTESALYFDISFNEADDNKPFPRPKPPTGGTLRQNFKRKKALDKDSDLPIEIASLLQEAMKKVYYQEGIAHPNVLPNGIDGLPTTDQLSQAYSLLYSYLKMTSSDGFDHERPELPPLWGNLDGPLIPSLDLPPGLDSPELSVLDLAFSLVCILFFIVALVAWVGSVAVALVADVVVYPIRCLLYYVELAFFYLVKDTRAYLVLTGFMAPMEDEIALGLVKIGTARPESYNTVRAEMGDVFGGLIATTPASETDSFRDPSYPHLHETGRESLPFGIYSFPINTEYLHPWSYPQTASELGLTTASPYAKGADPSVLFNNVPTDPNIRDLLTRMAVFPAADPDVTYPTNPWLTDNIDKQLTPLHHLGDAPNFSMYLIWLLTRDVSEALGYIVDFNLDGDRGYGYKCWDWVRRNDATSKDPLGHTFKDPKTWPSQSGTDENDKQKFNPDVNLKIEYLPRITIQVPQPPIN